MLRKIKKFRITKYLPYILSFSIPILIMLIYAIYKHMFPFGSSSILTIDMDQQYLEFFAYFRRTLLKHLNIFYSFSLGLGQGTLSLWAYYLMSPLNLLLLLFSGRNLAAGILLITLLKYGFSGLSFSYLLHKGLHVNKSMIVVWSIAYALNGWMISDQLNIMWLDALIWLPLVFLGLLKLLYKNKKLLYIFALTAIIISNFYVAYMIGIFTVLYTAYYIISIYSRPNLVKYGARYILSSLTSIGISAFVWLPTYIEFENSGTNMNTVATKQFAYNPLDLIAKFYNGAYNIKQMSSGLPAIFVGSLVVIGFFYYMLNKKIQIKKRLSILIITLILLATIVYEPLAIFCQGNEIPIWYLYRNSFIICFWLIIIAAQGLQKSSYQQRQHWIVPIGFIGIASLLILLLRHLAFLRTFNLIVSAIIFVITLLVTAFLQNRRQLFWTLLSIVIIDMGANAYSTLNHLSYVPNNSYVNFNHGLTTVTEKLKAKNKRPFRINSSFYSSLNDAMMGDYMNGNAFSATLNVPSLNYAREIGIPSSSSKEFAYTNGTPITDSLLGFKYELTNPLIQDTPTNTKYGENMYPIIKRQKFCDVRQNKYTMPLLTMASNRIYGNVLASDDPIRFQTKLFNRLTNSNQVYFQKVNGDLINSNNLTTNKSYTLNNSTVKLENRYKYGYINLNIPIKTDNPYYLEVGSNFNKKLIMIYKDNKVLNQNPKAESTSLRCITDHAKGSNLHLMLKIKHPKVWLNGFHIYQFNMNRFKNSYRHYNRNLAKITQFKNGYVKANVNAANNYNVMTTSIPYEKGWHLKVDDHDIPIKAVNDEFISAPLSKGRHKVQLQYQVPGLKAGLIISLISIIFVIGYDFKRHMLMTRH